MCNEWIICSCLCWSKHLLLRSSRVPLSPVPSSISTSPNLNHFLLHVTQVLYLENNFPSILSKFILYSHVLWLSCLHEQPCANPLFFVTTFSIPLTFPQHAHSHFIFPPWEVYEYKYMHINTMQVALLSANFLCNSDCPWNFCKEHKIKQN